MRATAVVAANLAGVQKVTLTCGNVLGRIIDEAGKTTVPGTPCAGVVVVNYGVAIDPAYNEAYNRMPSDHETMAATVRWPAQVVNCPLCGSEMEKTPE